ncbi:hypothetical protein [Yersinia aldovae]|uniref:hypothetical protein n=1 Tax=Yersinia aldovae TaxID=29483 RepID=UPI0005AD5BB4|nr:hypothetical protein [Yersinia aldovae]AJJ63189.1 hypothetical protein AT01_728 [Yersinia aldovae 670-83]
MSHGGNSYIALSENTGVEPTGTLDIGVWRKEGASTYLQTANNLAEIAAAGPEAIAAAIANLGLTDTAAIATNALQKNQNLNDVADKTAARTNLGLKGAAVLDIGKTTGTVAAGDDSRIVEAISSQNTNIQLPGILGSKGLQVFPLPGSPEGGEINLYDKDNIQAAYIDIDSAGAFRVVTEGVGISLHISKTSGDVFIQKTLTAGGVLKASGIVAEGTVYAGNTAAWLEANGNVYGPLWGGHLSTYLANRTDHRVRAWAALQGNGTIISSFGFAAINRTNVGGYNFVMSTSNGAYAVTVGINGGSQYGAQNAHSANIWNRSPNSFSVQNSEDGGTSYGGRDWPEFYVIVVGP